MFPSSFYGIKQQFSAKKAPPINADSNDQTALTIKKFAKKWSIKEALKQNILIIALYFLFECILGTLGRIATEIFDSMTKSPKFKMVACSLKKDAEISPSNTVIT